MKNFRIGICDRDVSYAASLVNALNAEKKQQFSCGAKPSEPSFSSDPLPTFSFCSNVLSGFP